MKNTKFMNGVTKTFNMVTFQLKKHSPEILLVGGVIGAVASTVLACRATTKVSGILDKAKGDIDCIHKCMDDESLKEEYTHEDGKKDLTIVYAQTGLELIKLYAPAVALGTLSIASICTSNNILRKRNMALAAAYATVDKSYKEYRDRVIERFGKDMDRELKYNIKAKEIEETVVDEHGNETTIKKTVDTLDPNDLGDFTFFFDETSREWTKDPEYNLMFLKARQKWATDRLRSRGYLFLNEVLDELDIDKTVAGQSVGWIYDEKNPVGDNFVDFGIYNIYSARARAFVNGYEPNILLDFNVDGDILHLFRKYQRA